MTSLPPGLRAPEPLSFEGNVAENWRRFSENFAIYRKAALKGRDADEIAYILLNLAGQEAIDREKTFTYKPEVRDDKNTITQKAESKEDPDCLLKKFTELCSPQKNVIVLRHKFNSRSQRKDETTESYITELKRLANDCEYGNLKNELIRDRIVCGISNENVRKQMLKNHELTLEKAIQLCQLDEITTVRMKEMNPTHKEIDEVKYTKSSRKCGKCGTTHSFGACPAYGQRCNKCYGRNHWAAVCKAEVPRQSESRHNNNSNKTNEREGAERDTSKGGKRKIYKKVYEVVEDMSDTESELHYIDSIETPSVKDEAHTTLRIGNKTLNVKVDTGAKISVMKEDILREINDNAHINAAASVTIKAYGGEKFQTLGTTTLTCRLNNMKYDIVFHVIPQSRPGTTLLGLNDCLQLGLVQLSKEVYQVTTESTEFDKFKHLFDDSIGKLPVEYKMDIDQNITPVVKPPRKVPIALKDDIRKELQRMEHMGVIEAVHEATEWVSSMVAVKKKNGDVRICIDPRDLNKALRRPHHPMKTIEEVISDIPGATMFSTIDAKSGFWQIPLSPESKQYTTFNTPFGRYRFARLPFGLNSSSEVFQRIMEQLFSGYPCSIIVDDILVWGANRQEHDENLQKVLERCSEINLKLNKKKCQFRVPEVSYVGHLLTSSGVKPDPAKIVAITEMPAPDDKKALQRVLGMTNYLSKFIENYSDKTAILRSLLHKDSEWCWLQQHQQAFEDLKVAITSPPTLKYYNSTEPVVITCDASKSGLGAAILQEKPVAFASRALTETEQRYAQIEKELLAITFACKKFHDYIFGRKFVVETDHKPLVTIIKKTLHTTPLRLQKMLLQLQRYDFELVYKEGKELHIADTLSRACIQSSNDSTEEEFEVMEVISISQRRAEEVRNATQVCDTLRDLMKYIKDGWPDNSKDVPSRIRPYFAFRDELTIQDGMIIKQNRVVIPESLQKEYLHELHRGHPGTEATKARGKDTVFWIGMSKDIDNMTRSCSPCNMFHTKQQKEPMFLHDIPQLPYEIVATDLFEWDNQTYLVTVDSYSGFFDIDKLTNTTSATVIMKLKRQFAIHGIPRVLLSDNGSQFASHQFKRFSQQWQFQHVTSSPRYAQSNGLAERAVRSAKSVLKKCSKDKSDPYLALLMMRNTPRPGLSSSAERLFSRKTRTTLPIPISALKPAIISNVPEALKRIRSQKKAYYDKCSKELAELKPGDIVRLEQDGKYERKGKVISKSTRPRGYVVNVNGRLYERNRKYLLKVNECADDDEPQPTFQQEPPPARLLLEDNVLDGATHPEDVPNAKKPDEIDQQQNGQHVRRSRYGRIIKFNRKYDDYV